MTVSEQTVRLTVAYDGTDFAGWQRQDGQRTAQGELESALDRMGVRHGSVRGASRTDAGVHALGQVCAFDTHQTISPYGWLRGLNTSLPDDLSVVEVAPAPYGYNPRFDCHGKTYRYLLQVGSARQPCWRRQSWCLGPTLARPFRGQRGARVHDWLNLEAMFDGARRLEGEHDFRAFRKQSDPRKTSVRVIEAIDIVPEWHGHEGLVAVEVRGNAFMQHMVRILVGTLVDVGREHIRADSLDELLDGDATRHDAGPTAPAHGLCLVSIELGRFDGVWPPPRG